MILALLCAACAPPHVVGISIASPADLAARQGPHIANARLTTSFFLSRN